MAFYTHGYSDDEEAGPEGPDRDNSHEHGAAGRGRRRAPATTRNKRKGGHGMTQDNAKATRRRR